MLESETGRTPLPDLNESATRRRFLRTAGLGGTLALIPGVFACDDDVVAPDDPDPFALFTVTPSSAAAGQEVQFDASDSFDPRGDDLTYQWNFGDGSEAQGVMATHTYDAQGSFDVALIVTDPNGNTDTATRTLEVGAAAVSLDLASDIGVLNFAYALEQLEAAFYTQVVASFYTGATADEQNVLTDLRDHEIAHREFFKAVLGDDAIPGLTPNFDAVDFTDRISVLQTARTFEDLGVAAYNGAGSMLESATFLTLAGKIVSVEARHASVIRTLLGRNFAPEAFDDALEPSAVLTAASPFIENMITLQNA